MSERTLHVGQTQAGDDFTLPATISVQATATMGKRGTGKTVTASVLVEEMLKQGIHVVVIDPVDVWWGLKADAEGEEEGFPILTLGGSHSDLPLEADQGQYLADFAVERRVPMILSLRHLRKAKQRQFVIEFAEQLYHRKGEPEHRVPLHLVVDEASRFIPQQARGNLARSVGAFEDIVRQGRADGFGVTLIDQRPATVNKNVLSQVDTLIAHMVTSPHDRSALTDWVKQHDQANRKDRFLDTLASLDLGQAWFWNSTLDVFERVDVRMRETYDSSRTPEPGEDISLPEKMASVDLDELRDELEQTIEEAERRDPDRLQERIAELKEEVQEERQLAEAAKQVVPADHVCEGADEEAVEAARREARRDMAEKVEEARRRAVALRDSQWKDLVESMERRLADYEELMTEVRQHVSGVLEEEVSFDYPEDMEEVELPEKESFSYEYEVTAPETDGDTPEVGGTKQSMLDTLFRFRALGVDELPRQTVAVHVGLSPNSSSVGKHLSDLREAGLVTYPRGGMVKLTAEGRSAANVRREPHGLEELHEQWIRAVRGNQKPMLERLIEAYPESVQREELAEAAGLSPTSSSVGKHVSQLQKCGAATYPQPGMVRASERLFPDELMNTA